MNRKQKFTALVTTLSLLSTFTYGCSSKQESQAHGDTQQVSKEAQANTPLKVTMSNVYFTTEPPKSDSEFMKKFEELTHTRLEMTWIPNPALGDKLTAMIAGNDLPQIFFVNEKSPVVVNSIRSGMFWEIGPLLKQYPNLSKLPEISLQNTSVDGKIYAIPKLRELARDGIVFRKDWLDNLGLKEPKTLDELLKVLKAFTENDPDKNGKNDTYGFASKGPVPTGFKHFMMYYGGSNEWEIKDGKFVPDFMTQPYIEVMKLYRQMYQDKWFNQDFAVLTDSTTLINKGKAGVYFNVLDDVSSRFTELQKSDPKAVLDVIGPIEGKNGKRIQAGSGYNGMYLFPKTSIKTEADLKQILARLDKFADPAVQDLLAWGIEGKHFKLENGMPVRIDDKVWNDEIWAPYNQLRYDRGESAKKGEESAVIKKYKQLQNDDAKYAVPRPIDPFNSDTMNSQGKQLSKLIDDARVKFIMGQLDEAGFNKVVDQWLKEGGSKVIEEYSADYAKANKK